MIEDFFLKFCQKEKKETQIICASDSFYVCPSNFLVGPPGSVHVGPQTARTIIHSSELSRTAFLLPHSTFNFGIQYLLQ
jgi:hypothetical protein